MSATIEIEIVDLAVTPLRELNQRLHDSPRRRPAPWRIVNPNGAHAVAVRPRRRDRGRGRRARGLLLRRHEQARDGARARQRRRRDRREHDVRHGRGDGNASQSAGRPARGGLLVVHGDASARCGISMKGVDIVVRGSVGHMSAFMAQTGRLVVCGDAGEALGDSIYEARLYVRGAVAGARRRLRREGDARRAPCRARRLLAQAGVDGSTRRVPPLRLGAPALHSSRSTTPGSTDATTGWQPGPARVGTFDRDVIAEIQRAAREGIYDIRGFGAKRKVPHFDDLLFLGASVSRYPLEGYRERCDTDVMLGDALREEAAPAEDPDHDRGDELRRAVGAREGGARARRDRDGHVDDDRRRRHDGGGARALRDARLPAPPLPLRHEPGRPARADAIEVVVGQGAKPGRRRDAARPEDLRPRRRDARPAEGHRPAQRLPPSRTGPGPTTSRSRSASCARSPTGRSRSSSRSARRAPTTTCSSRSRPAPT